MCFQTRFTEGISEDGSYMDSIVDIYDKGDICGKYVQDILTCRPENGMDRFKSQEALHLCLERRDYDTISCGMIDDMLASLALANKEKIFERNRAILKKNRQILDDWVNSTRRYTT